MGNLYQLIKTEPQLKDFSRIRFWLKNKQDLLINQTSINFSAEKNDNNSGFLINVKIFYKKENKKINLILQPDCSIGMVKSGSLISIRSIEYLDSILPSRFLVDFLYLKNNLSASIVKY